MFSQHLAHDDLIYAISERSTGAKAMVQKALTTDMLRRPTVDDLLADAWLSAHREEVHAGALGGIS